MSLISTKHKSFQIIIYHIISVFLRVLLKYIYCLTRIHINDYFSHYVYVRILLLIFKIIFQILTFTDKYNINCIINKMIITTTHAKCVTKE